MVVIQWWETSKVHIKGFCQQYATHSSLVLKKTLELQENEIIDIEKTMTVNDTADLQELGTEKKNQLRLILNEKAYVALLRSHIF